MKGTLSSPWKDVHLCVVFIILNCIFHIPNQHSIRKLEIKFFKNWNPIFCIYLIGISQVLLPYYLANKKTGEGI